MNGSLERYGRYLESLTAESLSDLPNYVAQDVRFSDPFNDVAGVDEMGAVFRHMFDAVKDIRFTVLHAMQQGEMGLMHWRFAGLWRNRPWSFEGTSLVQFDRFGKVIEHIDYWDAASAVYQRLPLIGPVLSALRRQIRRR